MTSRRAPIQLLALGTLLLFAGAMTVWVAMHANLYGTGGQYLTVFRLLWQWLPGAGGTYPIPAYAENFLLRPGLIVYAVGYLILLAALKNRGVAEKIRLRHLVLLTVAVGLPFLLMPYMMSSDIFDYISYGKLAAVHGTNPYLSSISEFPEDPLYKHTFWKTTPSVYGPAWTIVSVALLGLANLLGGSLSAMLLVFRGSMFLFQIAAGVFIWIALERGGTGSRPFRTALFLLNPLVMTEFPGNGHNEAMMIALIAGAIVAEQRGRWVLATFLLVLAAQTKFYCLPVFCLYAAYRCWRSDSPAAALRSALSSAMILVATSLVLYYPFGINTTLILAPLKGPGGAAVTKSLAAYLLSHDAAKTLETVPLLGILFRGYFQADLQRIALFLTATICLAGALRSRTFSHAVTAMAAFALFWCVFGATWFMPWYVTLALTLVVFSNSKPLFSASVVLSFSVFVIYLLEGYSFSVHAERHNFAVSQFQLLVFVPCILAFLATFAWERYAPRRGIDTLPPENF